jgi:hypothetical protein
MGKKGIFMENKTPNSGRKPVNGFWEWVGYLAAAMLFMATALLWKSILAIASKGVASYKARKGNRTHTPGLASSSLPTLGQHVMGVINPFDPAIAFASVSGDGWSVTLRQYQGRIERTLKTRRDRMSWQRAHTAFNRVELSAFTPDDAKAAKLTYDLHGAKQFTQKELGRRKFTAPAVELIDAEIDLQQAASPQPESMQQEQIATATVASDEMSTKGKAVAEASGVVVSAGVIDVQIEGKKPYKTFSMSVKASDGLMHEFAGNDLHEKFNAREFSVGDHITVIKSRVQFTVGGRNRSKNVFAIDVIEKCMR